MEKRLAVTTRVVSESRRTDLNWIVTGGGYLTWKNSNPKIVRNFFNQIERPIRRREIKYKLDLDLDLEHMGGDALSSLFCVVW